MIDDMRIFRTTLGVNAGGPSAGTIVVFATQGDTVLLGAYGLEGLNLRVDREGAE